MPDSLVPLHPLCFDQLVPATTMVHQDLSSVLRAAFGCPLLVLYRLRLLFLQPDHVFLITRAWPALFLLHRWSFSQICACLDPFTHSLNVNVTLTMRSSYRTLQKKASLHPKQDHQFKCDGRHKTNLRCTVNPLVGTVRKCKKKCMKLI